MSYCIFDYFCFLKMFNMSTRISTLTVVLLMICLVSADAQRRSRQRYKLYEIHGGIGAANVFGDLGGAATRDNWGGLKDIQFSQTRPTFYVAEIGRAHV